MKKLLHSRFFTVGFEFFIASGLLAILINIIYCLSGKYIDYEAALWLSVFGLIIGGSIPLYRRGYKNLAKIVAATSFNLLVLFIALHLGLASGVVFYYFPYIISYFYIFREGGSQRIAYAYFAVSLLILGCIVAFVPEYAEQSIMPLSAVRKIYYFSLFLTFVFTGIYFAFIYQYQIRLREKLMGYEMQRKKQAMEYLFMQQEREKENLVNELRNNINQGLVSSKMFLELAKDKGCDNSFLQKGYEQTLATIHEMGELCDSMDPSIVRELGLREGLNEFISVYSAQKNVQVKLEIKTNKIEELSFGNKLSVFRIIQNYLWLVGYNEEAGTALIELDYRKPELLIQLKYQHPTLEMVNPERQSAWSELNYLIENFGGKVWQQASANQYRINIGLELG